MLGCSYAGQVLESLLAAVSSSHEFNTVQISSFQNADPESEVLTLPRNVNYWVLPGVKN